MKVNIVNVKESIPYHFYVGRKNKTYSLAASSLANPFVVKRESERDSSLEQYAKWLDGELMDVMGDAASEFYDILNFLREHHEVTLACFCSPKRCHCEIIASKLFVALYPNEDDREGVEWEVRYQSNKTPRKSSYKIKQNPLMESWRDTWNEDLCKSCNKCVLHESRTHSVWMRGNGAKGLLIVGEAPGEDEDKLALPFIGASGKMLEKILHSVGLDSQEDCWIVNACKCRPSDNRTPTAKEIDTCFPYLQSQIVELMPKVILALGQTSTKRLIGKSDFKITNCRGKKYPLDLSKWDFTSDSDHEVVLRLSNIIVVPTFHPSYLLRNPQKQVASPKWYVWQDVQLVKNIIDDEEL